jgi:hypothetical protein
MESRWCACFDKNMKKLYKEKLYAAVDLETVVYGVNAEYDNVADAEETVEVGQGMEFAAKCSLD